MIFVFAEGGTGSVYFSNCVNVGVRPDTVWGFKPPLQDKPKIPSDAFRKRSSVDLNLNETIEGNLVRMLKWRENMTLHTMLSGRCSQSGMFLRDNGIKAFCFVRHPLHSFVSFLGHRHPEHAKKFGGFNTIEAVKFYALLWNAMTDDFLRSGNPIFRFEYMPGNIIDPWLQSRLEGWDNTKRNHGVLDKSLELQLESYVADNYYSLYDGWDI